MNSNMIWDFITCEIRSVTIKYSINISRNRAKNENALVKKNQ